MSLTRFSFFAFVTTVMAGCMTIFNAQETQRALCDKGNGCDYAGAPVCLADYSLRELVGFAMTNRPSIVAAALEVADARLALLEIAADAPLVSYSPWTSPHLALSGGYSAASEGSKHLNAKTEGNASAGLSVDVLVYDFGRNLSLANEQAERVLAAEYAFVQEGYVVFEEVASAYFNLLTADAMLEVAKTNEYEYAIHLQQAEDMLAAGEAKRLDVTRARLDLSQAQEMLVAASNTVDTAGAELMRALGVDAARGTRNEVFPASGQALRFLSRGFADTHYETTEAFDLARTNAPVMAVARARLRSASYRVDYAIADLMPSISATVGISWADPVWAWHWGVNAVQTIFQGFRKTTAVDRAVVQLQISAAAVDEAEQQLSLEIEQAIAVRDNAIKACATAKASMRSAKENLDTVKEQYREGDASRVDFTDSVSDYATALGSRVNAFYKGQIAEAKLFALIGRVPEFLEEEERLGK